MKKPDLSTKIFINLALLATVAGGFWWVHSRTPKRELKRAPHFELPLVQWTNESKANRDSKELMATQGDLLSLDQFKGQFTLINFWASWCEACALESPLLRELWEVYGTKGRLAMIGVASFDKWSDLRVSSKLLAMDYPVVFDDKGRVALKYGVTVLPVSVLINPQGLILATFPGVLNQEKLRVIESQIP